jgi:hypothetical protein
VQYSLTEFYKIDNRFFIQVHRITHFGYNYKE